LIEVAISDVIEMSKNNTYHGEMEMPMSVVESGDVSFEQILHAMSVVLVTTKATEKRAASLLAVAKAPPERLHRARGIYVRARARSERLLRAMSELMIDFADGAPVETQPREEGAK
jgi:hypothetical protein